MVPASVPYFFTTMKKQGKVWGITSEIFNNGNVSLHYLKIRKGGYCSEHFHLAKSNIFVVLAGELKINIFIKKNNTESIDSTILKTGQETMVLPQTVHSFEAMTEVECLEIYTSEIKNDDIIRRNSGGIHD